MNKKVLSLFVGVSAFAILVSTVIAAPRGRMRREVSNTVATPAPVIQPEKDKVMELIGIPGYLVNSESCELFYSMCMNKYCIQDDVKGACSCSASALNMNKDNGELAQFYDLDGYMVKEGIELLQYSETQCKAILDKCSGMESGLKNSFAITSQSDCVGWAAKNPEVEPTIYDELKQLEACMEPVCKGDKGMPDYVPFVKCFDLDEAEVLLNECSHIIAKSHSNLGLKEYFVNSMKVRMQDFCADLGHASTADDPYGCDVKVSYGVTSEKPLKEMTFKMGDTIMCSQEYFGTETPVVKSIAKQNAKKMKNRAYADTINGGVQLVAAVANVATPGGNAASTAANSASKGIDAAAKAADKATKLQKFADSAKYAKTLSVIDKTAKVSSYAAVGTSLANVAVSASGNEKLKKNVGEVAEVTGKAASATSGGTGATVGALAGAGVGAAMGGVGNILSAAGDITNGIADIKKYSAIEKYSVEVRAKGSCWVNGQMVAQEGQVMTLMWKDFYKF
ncbi:MAG: hypothetical protein N4A44_02920 [Alphaproteobacteria bacterium]|jgi:hypothetical protein|nr:hypothetical protein [Alphaproteobacteria bacterium]